MSKRSVIAAIAMTVGVLVLAAPALADRWMNRRDEAGYVHYLAQYFPGWWSSDAPGVAAHDRAWTLDHPSEVLAEGDAACAWLADQPRVPDLVPSGDATIGATRGRYLSDTTNTTKVDIDARSRSMLVAGAWTYLCKGLVDSRTSPASNEPDD